MENNVNSLPYEGEERVLPGTVGALLFSLAGGVVWFILWQLGIVAGLSGIIGVICAIKGYGIFAKRQSIKGVVISVICALAIIVFAWYLCMGYDYYLLWQEVAAQVPGYDPLPLSECLFSGFELLDLADAVGETSVRGEYISNLVFGIVFTVIGGVGYVVQAVKNSKNAPVSAPQTSGLNGNVTERTDDIPKE